MPLWLTSYIRMLKVPSVLNLKPNILCVEPGQECPSFLPYCEVENLHSAERFLMVILLLRLRNSSDIFAPSSINHYVKNSQLEE